MSAKFDAWIRELDVDVIQGDYGYEDGELAVYSEHWHGMFREGLTPQQAFRRALDAHADARRDDETARAANWERIQVQDAAAVRSALEDQSR